MAVETITSSQTWTAPSWITSVDIVVQAGGGGGGSNASGSPTQGGGGGGGGTNTSNGYSVTPGNGYIVVVGSNGIGGTSNGDGSDGGDSSFDGAISATGGHGGQGDLNGGAGGTGGSPGGSDGSDGLSGSTGGSPNGGAGGNVFQDGSDGGTGYVQLTYADPPPSPPDTPTGLVADSNLLNHITLSWDSTTGADAYRIYRSDDSYTSAIYDGSSNSFDNTGLGNGVTFSYKVTAYNTGGESSKSSSVSATTLMPASYSHNNGIIMVF